MQTAREIAKAWRANPADRLRIEREIAAAGRQAEFSRNRDGDLVARITSADRERITNSGGGAFRGTSADRQFAAEMLSPEIVAAAGMGFQRETHTGLIHLDEAA